MTSPKGQTAPQPVNPFISRQVECPLCGSVSTQLRLKQHLFIEQEREVDMRPGKLLRKKDGLEDFQPLLYHIWHCPTCHFAADEGVYAKPTKNLGLTSNKFKEALLSKADPQTRVVAAKLAADLPGAQRDHGQAMRLYWLAMYQLHLIHEATGVLDGLNMGRYSLRLAWLFRDLKQDPRLEERFGAQVAETAAWLKKSWDQAPADEEAALALAVQGYESALREARGIESELEAVNLALLISRIYLKSQDVDQSRLLWSKATEITRAFESHKRETENQLHQLERKLKTASQTAAVPLRAQVDELTPKVVAMDSTLRNMRFKVGEVRDLVQDFMASQARRAQPGTRKDPYDAVLEKKTNKKKGRG